MIWFYLIKFVTTVLSGAFSWLPQVTTLPVIAGVDVDTMLVQAMSTFYGFIHAWWMIGDLFLGVLAVISYLSLKMLVKLLFGHRAPA